MKKLTVQYFKLTDRGGTTPERLLVSDEYEGSVKVKVADGVLIVENPEEDYGCVYAPGEWKNARWAHEGDETVEERRIRLIAAHFVETNSVIQCVKLYRELANVGLKEAKDWIESNRARLGISPREAGGWRRLE